MKKYRISTGVLYFIITVCAAVCIFPLLFALGISFTDEDSLRLYGFRIIPAVFSLSAYKFILATTLNILTAYKVSIIVTVSGTSLSLVTTALLSYSLSRKEFPLHNVFAFVVYFTMLFSGGLIPLYILVTRYLHLTDKIIALILPMLLNPFYILLLRTFFRSIPVEMMESANLDGAGDLRTFLEIAMPVSLPGLATIGLLYSLGYWNDWFQAFLYISTPEKYPLQYLLQRIQQQADMIAQMKRANTALADMVPPAQTAKMAMCILATGPVVLVYPFFQRYFIRGLTVGSVKA